MLWILFQEKFYLIAMIAIYYALLHTSLNKKNHPAKCNYEIYDQELHGYCLCF